MSENSINVNEIEDYKNEISIDFSNFTEDINKALSKHDSDTEAHVNLVSSILNNIESSANALTADTDAKLSLKADLATTSGINTGDETNVTIKSKLGVVSATNEGYVTPVQKAAWDAASVGGGKTLISSTDTTSDYLVNKLVGSSGITVTKASGGANESLTITPDSTITKQGNNFNGANELVKLNVNGQLPALDGSLLTNLIKSDGSVTFSAEQKGVDPVSAKGLTTLQKVQALISAIDYSGLATKTLSNVTAAASSYLNSVGIRTVVSSYTNGNSWYRVWSDGWIEQGGYMPDTAQNVLAGVSLLKPFSNANYNLNICLYNNTRSDGITGCGVGWYSKDSTSFTRFMISAYCYGAYWRAEGY